MLAVTQVAAALFQIGWFQFRIGMFGSSVRELKKMRAEAIEIRDFKRRKSIPILLLAAIREAITEHILLKEFEYEERKSALKLVGTTSDQSHVDQLINALERNPLVERLVLGGVQTKREEEGKVVYEFSVTGSLNTGKGGA